MRTSIIFRAFAAVIIAAFAMPASATVSYNVSSIFGTLTITRDTLACYSGSPDSCLQQFPGGIIRDTFLEPFSFAPFPSLIITNEGDTPFQLSGGDRQFQGIINNSGGVLTGRDLVVDFRAECRVIISVGCRFQTGSARTFSVEGGVPEPATWIMMLMGFGAIGFAFRKGGLNARPDRTRPSSKVVA